MAENIDLKKIKKIHFTGIKGVGMTALALCVKDMGIKVSGSDINELFVTDEVLKKEDIYWKKGFHPNNLKNPDLLIYTAAHEGKTNPEVKACQKAKIPVLSQAEALGLLQAGKKVISVAGVGGKTTTTAMIATVLKSAKLHPSWLVGSGFVKGLGNPGKYDSQGGYFICEADEYLGRFLKQNPQIIVVTNIEYDHPDVYKNLTQTLDTFKQFFNKIPANGFIVANWDNKNIQKIIKSIKRPIISYGISKKADWQINSINQSNSKTTFSIKTKQFMIKDIVLSVPGLGNIMNATAALITCYLAKISLNEIKKGLLKFEGVKRRFEFIKKINNIHLYDDYAHHPIQLKATLRAARKFFGKKRIIAIFQPHTYSRTKALLYEFSQSFSEADWVVITDIYSSAREKKDPGISGKILAEEIRKYQKEVNYKSGVQEVCAFLKIKVKPKDIIFTLGAGNIFHWHDSIAKAIESN